MGKIKNYVKQFHIIVWVLLVGTILARGAAFMTLPFLAIYLSKMELNPILIGLTIGISPLMATVGGFIGGNLSDRYGRKPIILISLFGIAFVYLGFSAANTTGLFILLNALNGLCNSFFEPTSQALMADLTSKENRMKAYSLRYTAINIGAAFGPLAGAYFASNSGKTTFIITGSIYLFYAISLLLLMNRFLPIVTVQIKEVVTIFDAFKIVKRDKELRYLILGVILVNAGYSQMQSNLPQHIAGSMENGVFIYSILLSINAVMVVFLQMPISHLAEKHNTMHVMIFGAFLTSTGLLCFSFATGWITAIIAISLFTFGEILIFPSNSLMIDQLAADHLRGTYFGAGQFRKLGNFAGPIIGGYFLSSSGGQVMLWIISTISIGGILFFLMGSRIQTAALQPVLKSS
jgi:MFS family permease